MTSVTLPARIEIGHPATLGCSTDLDRPYRWHWMRNGQIVGGSNSAASYQTPPMSAAYLGDRYSVTVWGHDGVETSEEVTLEMPIEPEVHDGA